jgi:hypothetical protein
MDRDREERCPLRLRLRLRLLLDEREELDVVFELRLLADDWRRRCFALSRCRRRASRLVVVFFFFLVAAVFSLSAFFLGLVSWTAEARFSITAFILAA